MNSVFLLTSGTVFGNGLECLLRRERGVALVGQETDQAKAIGRIRDLRPDVVIVERDNSDCDSNLALGHLLKAHGVPTIISLSLDSNWMITNCGEQRIVKRVEDLMDMIKASEAKDLEGAMTRVQDRITAEPSYRIALYKLLALCETPRSTAEVHQAMLAFPEMKTALHTPQMLLAWMVRAGGIEQVAPEKEESRWQTTEAGKMAAKRQGPGKRLAQFFAQEPAYGDVFRLVLEFCAAPKSKADIEALLKDHPAMENPKIYASFIVEGLEAAGGLEWDGHWRTTEAGKGVLA